MYYKLSVRGPHFQNLATVHASAVQKDLGQLLKFTLTLTKIQCFCQCQCQCVGSGGGGHYSRNISTPLFGLFLNREKKNLNWGKRGEKGSLTGREQGKETERKGKEKTARRKGESKRETSRKRKGQKG